MAGTDPSAVLADADAAARSPWYAASVDSTYLTGKRVFVFGDATHVVAAARVASQELGFQVVGLGTYSREFAREVREAAKLYGVEPLITDDYLEVEARITELQVELVLGTQMERHIAKRLKVPCAVISAPVHAEICFGLERLAAGSRRRVLLEAEYQRLRALLPWADWTAPAAEIYGAQKAALERAGTPIGDMDVIIASVALACGAGVATCNPRHFQRVTGLTVEDWRPSP